MRGGCSMILPVKVTPHSGVHGAAMNLEIFCLLLGSIR
jgi:hypothetical protein